MAWPSALVRTKNWGTEILTDSDLEGQFDLVINYVDAMMDSTSGHDHRATDNYGALINLSGGSIGVTGTLGIAKGGTGITSGFLNGPPVGVISLWPTTSAPTDYLLCDGTAVSRTTYSVLFALISTTFGTGDGSTTFNLPNFKGKVPVGLDGADTAFDAMGETGGAKTVNLAHTHTATGQLDAGPGGTAGVAEGGNYDNTLTATTASSGSAVQSVLQPYITINYIIRYQ